MLSSGMPRTHRAARPDEVPVVFGRAFYEGQTQPELDERVQLGKFLVAAASSPLLGYPLEVEHTREAKPDFRIKLGSKTIGVELSKVANRNLEQARHFQRKHKLGTLSVSPFLKGSSERRDREEVLSEGFCTPAMVFGNSPEDEDAFWLDQARTMIARKGAYLEKPGFVRYQRTWLLLWDRLSSHSRDLNRRAEALSYSLHPLWQGTWFSKIIIEQAHFERIEGKRRFSNRRNHPIIGLPLTPNFCPKTFAQLGWAARNALRRMRRRPTLVESFWKQAELF